MKLYVKGRNVKISDELQDHVQKKLSKLDRYLDNVQDAQADLAYEPTKSASDQYVIQLTLTSNGVFLRAEERGEDFYVALDAVLDKMQQQIVRFKGRRQSRHKGAASASTPSGVPNLDEILISSVEAPTPEAPEIVRLKRFALRPMQSEDAVEQMELLGHDFFVFRNADTEEVNVVYRRVDGNYGLIEPVTSK